jgi:oxygen-independent coproporphyrinogen-3 oxidase
MDTLGIYISVPFCRSKCTYCNFASGVFPDSYHQRYVGRLAEDIRGAGTQAWRLGAELPAVVDSVYLGGGTPSILAPDLLRKLFAALRGEFLVADNAEVTLECAPGQISDEFLAAMVDCGVNRVSFGVQSFVDREAAVTGRLHTREITLRDVERVRAAGIRSINADLIAGLPHQTASSWRESLEALIGSGVDHASVYMLEVDEDSRLGREMMEGGGRYHAGAVPSDDLVADFYLQSVQVFAVNGLKQYEISNFAQSGRESLHNKKYWLRQPYLGFGLDAHSMLRGLHGSAVRFQMGDDLQGFLDGAGFAEVQPVSRRQALEEAWFLGLRLNEGVALGDLNEEFREAALRLYGPILEDLIECGMLEMRAGRVRLTERGRLMSNEVFGLFLRDEASQEEELVMVD